MLSFLTVILTHLRILFSSKLYHSLKLPCSLLTCWFSITFNLTGKCCENTILVSAWLHLYWLERHLAQSNHLTLSVAWRNVQMNGRQSPLEQYHISNISWHKKTPNTFLGLKCGQLLVFLDFVESRRPMYLNVASALPHTFLSDYERKSYICNERLSI